MTISVRNTVETPQKLQNSHTAFQLFRPDPIRPTGRPDPCPSLVATMYSVLFCIWLIHIELTYVDFSLTFSARSVCSLETLECGRQLACPSSVAVFVEPAVPSHARRNRETNFSCSFCWFFVVRVSAVTSRVSSIYLAFRGSSWLGFRVCLRCASSKFILSPTHSAVNLQQAVVLKHNKPRPVLRIAASRRFSELTKNVIRSSNGHPTPSLKISCKSVQPFSCDLADKERKKDTYKHINKEIDRKQYPVPQGNKALY